MTEVLRLPGRPSSVPEARHFVLGLLEQWSKAELAETVALLVSEAVSNAVLHARTEIVLTAVDLGDAVQIDVRDRSLAGVMMRRHAADATTGRGVQLLDQLARSWEVVQDHDGKTVRFTVDGEHDPWAAYLDESWEDAEL